MRQIVTVKPMKLNRYCYVPGTLGEDNKRLRASNRQLKVKCERKESPQHHTKRLSGPG